MTTTILNTKNSEVNNKTPDISGMVYRFYDKKPGSGISLSEQLAEEWHKQVSKKFRRRKVYARFRDNTWAAGLTEMESFSANNKSLKCFLCVIDVFTKCGLVKTVQILLSKQ